MWFSVGETPGQTAGERKLESAQKGATWGTLHARDCIGPGDTIQINQLGEPYRLICSFMFPLIMREKGRDLL